MWTHLEFMGIQASRMYLHMRVEHEFYEATDVNCMLPYTKQIPKSLIRKIEANLEREKRI